jgi:hypothetical protein
VWKGKIPLFEKRGKGRFEGIKFPLFTLCQRGKGKKWGSGIQFLFLK